MPPPEPSVGRIVHYVTGPYGRRVCLAAIVTAVEGHAVRPITQEPVAEWVVSLVAFSEHGQTFHHRIVQQEGDHENLSVDTWHWPERVPAAGDASV